MRTFWIGVAASVVASVLVRHTPLFWLRDRVNAEVRAQERIAAALERMAERAERGGLPRPTLLP